MKTKYWQPFVSCIVNYKDEFLVIRRRKDGYFAGAYDFPGGKMEYDESIMQAVIREVFEETGIVINKTKIQYKTAIDWVDNFEDKIRYAVCFCFVYSVSEKVNVELSLEHDKYKWIKKDDSCIDKFIVNILNQSGFK